MFFKTTQFNSLYSKYNPGGGAIIEKPMEILSLDLDRSLHSHNLHNNDHEINQATNRNVLRTKGGTEIDACSQYQMTCHEQGSEQNFL